MRKWLAGVILALAAMLPVAAAAQSDTATLQPGSEIRFSLDDKGAITFIGGGGAQPSAFEAAAAQRLDAGNYGPQVGKNLYAETGDNLPAAAPVAPDQVRLAFFQVPGSKSVFLVVENGYDRALVYRARMEIQGRTQPTDVCIVIPKRRGFEHWPHRIDALELGSFRLQPWKDGDPVTCA